MTSTNDRHRDRHNIRKRIRLSEAEGHCQHQQNFFRRVRRRRQRVRGKDGEAGLLRQALMEAIAVFFALPTSSRLSV
jgi:hypothetical protein